MNPDIKFSLIVPTFGRPDEVDEFLESLIHQHNRNFEVIIADGSPKDDVRPVTEKYKGHYPLTVIYEKFLPVSDARNRGAEAAKGEWFIFLDSDCIIPEDYLEKVSSGLEKYGFKCFGGPDAAHESFSDVQKAISYSMTSLFTTGGIRGGTKRVGVFHPRGFNMGIQREVFKAVGGYSDFRCGEDIELSIRIIKAGYSTGLLPEAFVYHKRRTDFTKFFKQVFRFGAARINLYIRHKEELKPTHFFPLAFTLFWVSLPLQFLLSIQLGIVSTILLGLYKLLIFIDSTRQTKSIHVGFLSIRAAFVQLTGYGYGFFRNAIAVFILGNKNGMKL